MLLSYESLDGLDIPVVDIGCLAPLAAKTNLY
jgi:hypothetical protein